MLRRLLILTFVLTASSAWAQDAAMLQKGLDALRQGNFAEAATALEQHTRLQPEDLKALQALAEAYLQLKQVDLAEVTLKAAHALDRNDARTHLLRGRLRYAQQDFVRARSEFRTLEYLKQTNAELWYHLALTYKALGETEAADTALLEGLRDSTASSDSTARLLMLQSEFRPEQAEAALTQALALKNLSAELETELIKRQATMMIAGGRLGDLIQRQMGSVEASLKRKDLDAARRQLREIETWLGQSEFIEQDRFTYRKQLEALYEKMPGQALLRQQLIQLYQRQELYEDLLALYQIELTESAADWTPQEIGAAFHRIADVRLKMGYLQFAYDNYKRASEQNPRDFEAIKRMGVIYLAARDSSEAIKMFLSVMQEDPLDRENIIFLTLAQAYQRQDVQARQLLEQITPDIRPDVRAKVEAVLASEQREPEDDIWKLMIPDETILSGR